MKNVFRYSRIAILHLLYRFRPELPLTAKRAVIIAPHPDDEAIGCGGMIQALVKQGTPPHVIILTGGEGSHRGCCDITSEDLIAGRHGLTLKAAETMGLPMANVHCLQYPDGGVALEHPETERLAALLKELKPDAVFVPHRGEGWSDHVRVATIVAQITDYRQQTTGGESVYAPLSCRGVGSESPKVYEYCVWMWYYNVLDFRMKDAFLLRLSEKQHQLKQKAIEQYVTPTAPCGKPWSGVLPKPFLKATKWNKELYFLVR